MATALQYGSPRELSPPLSIHSGAAALGITPSKGPVHSGTGTHSLRVPKDNWTTRPERSPGLTCQLQEPEQTNSKELGVQELLLLCSVCNGSQQLLDLVSFTARSQL